MHKKLLAILIVLVFCICFVTHAAADTPYRSYDKTEWKNQLAAPNAYEPIGTINGVQAGSGRWETPGDIAIDHNGNFYIADTGNRRIVILDDQMKFKKEISTLKGQDGTEQLFQTPASVFVADNGLIYVADTDQARCVAIKEDGTIVQEFLKPTDKTFTSETFSPTKIQTDSKGMVYVISKNVFQGIMLYDQEGRFQGYFGSPSVDPSFRLLLDRFWKSILSKKQREGLARYVPVEYSNFCMDEEGFIYTTLSYTDSYQEQIRKLNYLGNNILLYTENFGEDEVFDYKREKWYTKFTGIAVDNQFIYALDAQWQRVYLFDRDGNRLAVFGTLGEQVGAFRSVQAILARNGIVYVLDRLKGNITSFAPTEYGELILEAVSLYNQGNYSEAVGPWQKVFAMDSNNQMAYNGIGEACLKEGNYEAAIKNFRLAYNRERESVAMEYYRSQWIREHIGLVVICMLVLFAALLLFSNRKFLAYLGAKRRKRKQAKEGRR